jgi:hypothetical protein
MGSGCAEMTAEAANLNLSDRRFLSRLTPPQLLAPGLPCNVPDGAIIAPRHGGHELRQRLLFVLTYSASIKSVSARRST